MDNPETLATLDTQDTRRREAKQNTENKNEDQQGPHQRLGDAGAREE